MNQSLYVPGTQVETLASASLLPSGIIQHYFFTVMLYATGPRKVNPK